MSEMTVLKQHLALCQALHAVQRRNKPAPPAQKITPSITVFPEMFDVQCFPNLVLPSGCALLDCAAIQDYFALTSCICPEAENFSTFLYDWN